MRVPTDRQADPRLAAAWLVMWAHSTLSGVDRDRVKSGRGLAALQNLADTLAMQVVAKRLRVRPILCRFSLARQEMPDNLNPTFAEPTF